MPDAFGSVDFAHQDGFVSSDSLDSFTTVQSSAPMGGGGLAIQSGDSVKIGPRYFSVLSAGGTHVGRVREHNEDGFLRDPSLRFYAVTDGLGGRQAGEVASAMTLDAIKGVIRTHRGQKNAEILSLAVRDANQKVL